MNLSILHYLLLLCGALATGLPALEAAFPSNASPYIKGAAAVFALLATVFGAISTPMQGSGPTGGTTVKLDPVTKAANDIKSPPMSARTTRLVSGVFAIALVVWVAGCALFGAVEPPIADCGTAILADAAKGLSVAQIVAAEGARCAVDTADVIVMLLASPKAAGTPAYNEAAKAKAKLVAQ